MRHRQPVNPAPVTDVSISYVIEWRGEGGWHVMEVHADAIVARQALAWYRENWRHFAWRLVRTHTTVECMEVA